jgi:hypothetical protein
VSNDRTTQAEFSDHSLAGMPEVGFSRAIHPNKLAALRVYLAERRSRPDA